MTPQPTGAPLRARSTSDLLELVPSLLGFHPEESLVAVVVRGGRVVVTARMDLPEPADGAAVGAALDPLVQRFPGATWLLVAYAADAQAAWAATGLVASLLPADADAHPFHVAEGRWHAYPGDPGCTYDPGSGVLAAEAAYRGVRVLPGRADLGRALEPTEPPAELERALNGVLDADPAVTLCRARSLVAAGEVGTEGLSLADCATLAVAAFSPSFADEVVLALDRANAPAAQRLWAAVVRASPGYAAAGALVLLGMAAWVGGEGALANICLERAAPAADGQAWHRFLDLACSLALPPTEWEQVRGEVTGNAGAA